MEDWIAHPVGTAAGALVVVAGAFVVSQCCTKWRKPKAPSHPYYNLHKDSVRNGRNNGLLEEGDSLEDGGYR